MRTTRLSLQSFACSRASRGTPLSSIVLRASHKRSSGCRVTTRTRKIRTPSPRQLASSSSIRHRRTAGVVSCRPREAFCCPETSGSHTCRHRHSTLCALQKRCHPAAVHRSRLRRKRQRCNQSTSRRGTTSSSVRGFRGSS